MVRLTPRVADTLLTEEHVRDLDAVVVAPDVYAVLFENDRVRVLNVTGVPGGTSPMHSHPDSVMHALTNGNLTITSQDGESQTVEIPSGATFWNAATDPFGRKHRSRNSQLPPNRIEAKTRVSSVAVERWRAVLGQTVPFALR